MPSRSITEKCVVSSGSAACVGDDVLAEFQTARCLGRVDRRGDRLRVLLGRQPGNRHVDEIRIAEVTRAIEIRPAHRFDLQVQRGSGQQPLRFQVEVLQDVEHFDQRHAAGAWRRHRDDLEPAVGALERRAFLRLIRGEILFRDQTAVGLHVRRDQIGDRPFVESVRAAFGDGAQRLAQVGQDETIAFVPVPPPALPYAATEAANGFIAPCTSRFRPSRKAGGHREALLREHRRRA